MCMLSLLCPHTPYNNIFKLILFSVLVYLSFDCNLFNEIRCRIFHVWHYVATEKFLGFDHLDFGFFAYECLTNN